MLAFSRSTYQSGGARRSCLMRPSSRPGATTASGCRARTPNPALAPNDGDHILRALSLLLLGLPLTTLAAQTPGFGVCKPVAQRSSEAGCWILVDQPVG